MIRQPPRWKRGALPIELRSRNCFGQVRRKSIVWTGLYLGNFLLSSLIAFNIIRIGADHLFIGVDQMALAKCVAGLGIVNTKFFLAGGAGFDEVIFKKKTNHFVGGLR